MLKDKKYLLVIGLSPVITFLAVWIVKSFMRMPEDLMGFIHAIATALK